MSTKSKRLKSGLYEREGISVGCPVCIAAPGQRCHGQATHEERRKRAAVFAEMRVEGIKAQARRRQIAIHIARQNRALERRAKRKAGPVVVKQAADLSPAERARYGL